MKKYLFLSAEDRRPVEESGYRYKKSKPVTAVKTNGMRMVSSSPGQYSDRWEKKDFSANSSGRVPSAEQQISA